MATPFPQEKVDRMRRLYEVHSLQAVADIIGCEKNVVWRAKKRGWIAGRAGKPARPMPTDFRIMANRLPFRDLMTHYGASQGSVRRWIASIDRHYVSEKLTRPPKPVPPVDDLRSAIATLGLAGAAARFGVCSTTLQKWRAHHGLPVNAKPKPARPQIGWAERRFASSTRHHQQKETSRAYRS